MSESFDARAWLQAQKPNATTQSATTENMPFSATAWLNAQQSRTENVGEQGKKQAVDFAEQLAKFPTASPVQQYQAFEKYGQQFQDHLAQQGYSADQIAKELATFGQQADPRNQSSGWDTAADLGNSFVKGTGRLMVDALSAVPESTPLIGELAEYLQKEGEGKLRTIEKEYSTAKQINDYLGNLEEQKSLENGANEVSALLANLKTNPMQLPHLFAEQVPQVLLGAATGGIGFGAVNTAGSVGRTRNDIEQAYEDTYKNNPQQLLQLPEIQERMAKGMSFADAVNDAKTDVTDHWKSLAAAAVIGASEALTPTAKLGLGVNRGVLKTLGKEAGQEFLQEGAEQLNSNLAVGQIDGKTQATDNVLRNATLGAIAGLGMGVPAATEAYINGRNAPQSEQTEAPVVNSESPKQADQDRTQAQQTSTPINSQALDEALKPYQDSEDYAEMRADLERDIEDGVIEERAKSNSQYGKLAQAYLNATGQATAEPQAESNTQEQTEIDDGTDPEMERVLNLRERMTAWRNGKKLGKIGDLLPAMMTFKNEEAKRDFVMQQAFGEVQSIAKKHGIDPTDGNAMRKWLDDYVAKRKEAQTKAKQTREESYRAYDDFLSNEPLAAEPQQAVENPQNVATQNQSQAEVESALQQTAKPEHFTDAEWQIIKNLAQAQTEVERVRNLYGKSSDITFDDLSQAAENTKKAIGDLLASNVTPEQFNQYRDLALHQVSAQSNLQQTANIAPTEPRNVLTGTQDSVDIGENNYQPFQYEVMEADDLAPTQQKAGNQLRDRERTASQAQVNKIARNLDPRKVAESPTMDFGAPLLAQDGKTVIAGNGRSMAIRQAYAEGNADNYRQYLQQNAAKFGVDGEQLAAMKNPVLVRRLNTAVDIKQTAINSNEQGGMRMSNLKQAKVDAQRLPNMAGFELDESGNLNTPNNRGFISQFIQNQPETLRNELLDKEGKLSQTGVQRLRNAMLYQAYGDTDTLARAVESTDQGARNIINALTRIAPKVAQVKQDIANGDVNDVDISSDIVQAVEKYNQLKNQNQDVGEYLQQQDFVSELSPEAKSVLRIFDENSRSSKRISDILTSYYQAAETQGNAAQSSMFGEEEFDKAGTLEQAKNAELEERYSRSPIKSVEANIKRGREAMNTAIAERRTVHRAMFNHNLDGWVDFEWGDVGTVKANGKTKGGMGISHILEARMRKDGMSYEQATQMLVSDVVDVIARGHTVFSKTVGNSQNIRMEHNGYQVTLTKNKGNNAWIVTAFELFEGANRKGYDKSIPTDTNPTLSRAGTGASNAASDSEQFARNNRSQLNDTHAHSQRGRGVVAENGLNLNNSQQNVNLEESHARELLRRALGQHADKIEFVRDEQFGENDARRGAEGWYHNGKLYLNLDGITDGNILSKDERLVWVAWHELGHHGVEVQLSHALRNQLRQARKNVVVNGIANRIFVERRTEAKRENNPNLEISQEVATEEAIVELFAAMETGNWAEIESRYNVKIKDSWRSPQGDLAKRLSYLANFFKRLVARITGKNLDTVSNQEVLDLLATVKQGIAKSAENSTASEARYSLSEESDSDFAKAVDVVTNKLNALKAGEQVNGYPNQPITLGTTPDVLKMLGYADVDVQIGWGTVEKIMRQHFDLPRGKHSNIHNLSPDVVKQIPQQLNNPVAIYESGTKDRALVVLTELSSVEKATGKESPVVVALHFAERQGKLNLINVASAYERNANTIARDDLSKRNVLYVNKAKGQTLIEKDPSLQLASVFSEGFDPSANDIKTETDLSQYQSENSDPLFSRKQTSMEILTDGKVKHETLWGTVEAGEFEKIWNEVQRKTDFALTDETRPVLDWIGDLDLAQVQANELKSDFELADGVRHSLNSQLMQHFLKPLHKNIVNLAKKHKKDIEWTKKALGIWTSANYSIKKNQELLARDEQAMRDAKQAFDDAKANGTAAEIDKAERAYIRAERQYRYRKHDVELNNWEVDEKGKFIVPRKVGVAGFSIPHAKALMAEVEKHFSPKEVQDATKPLREAVEWNIRKNFEHNRITEEQFKEYMRNLDYVPLTGDPDSLLKDDDDFIGGASSKGVNVSLDHNKSGARMNSEAEDAIDAVYRMLDKTVANAAWQPFKNGIDTVYEQKLAEAKAQGMTEEQAKEHVADTVGIRRQVMQDTTRTNDEVLIRKFGNVYYEYRLPEDVIKAIKGGQRDVDEFKVWQHKLSPMRYVRKLTSLYAQGVTQFKLPFAPKNMIRDIWEKSALITTRDIYDTNGKPLSQKAKNRIGSRTFAALANPAEMARVLRATGRLAKGDTENLDVNNEYQRDLKELIELGGVSNYSTYLARTDKDLVEEIKKLDKPHHRAVEGALHLVAVWNGTFDYASSLAAYRALKEAGVDKKQAANITLNLTNFRKQGWAAKHFKPLYMFLNPTLQGGKNLVQMMKTRRGQVYLASRVVMAMAVWSLLMSLDDEDDQGGKRMLANGDLSREILIPTGEKDKYIRIPVGYGAPQMANNIATNLVQLMNNQISVGDAVANIITHNVKSVLPIAPSEISASKDPLAKLADTLTPSLFKSQMQWLMDRNAFGASIKPNSVQREKLLSQQSRQNTAEFWKDTAEMMYEQFGVDMHPEFYKHIFDSYRGMMGSLGDYVSASIENPNRALQGKSEVVPIFNDYYGVRGENRIAGFFFEYKGEAEKLAAEYKYYEEKGRLAEWKTPEKMQIVNWNNKVNDEMKKVTQARSKLKKDEGRMSEEMKASRLQNINTINDRIQREAVYAWRKREGLATANPR